MPTKIPEFILRNMFVRGSLQPLADGFTFQIKDTYAPATVTAFGLEVDGQAVSPAAIRLKLEGDQPVQTVEINSDNPFALPVNRVLDVFVDSHPLGEGRLRIKVETREVGTLSFTIRAETTGDLPKRYPRRNFFKRLFPIPLKSEALVYLDEVVGEIDPRIYGHFVEHLENCVYGGVFTADGDALNSDVTTLVKALHPPVIRYPGGNFASDYHWEEGIGPKDQRPVHTDRAWHVDDSNRVGTDEFMAFCEEVGAAPFLVINDGSGTPQEAVQWVAYCNEPADGPSGAKRAANGHPEPYHVKLWGLGNEVWGEWQVGHTDAAGYVARSLPFIEAMRQVDPEIKLVAVGLEMLDGDPLGAEAWNRTVLEGLANRIDYLSFHTYQPSEEGYQAHYDPEKLHHSIVSAPHSTEDAIRRMAQLIREVVPDRDIGIALDEWNVKLPPSPGARSMHDLTYTLRDGLYIAGMLNVFHRQCKDLKIANIALLVNTLPVIVKPQDSPAFPTPLYFPFRLYREMESNVLEVTHWSPFFHAEGLGLNITERERVPYLDLTATCSKDRSRLVMGVTNRHPFRKARMMINLRGEDPEGYRGTEAWLMSGTDPLAVNTENAPDSIGIRKVKPPAVHFAWLDLELPPASLMVFVLEKKI